MPVEVQQNADCVHIKEADVGRLLNAIRRTYGIRSATYDKWKGKYGGFDASDVKRLKELEHENGHLKRMYVELSLEHAALKDVLTKKRYGLLSVGRSSPLGHARWPSGSAGLSNRGDFSRATYYRPLGDGARREAAVIEALTTLGTTKPLWGFWKYVDPVRFTGHRWNHTRLWRVYCRLRLNLPRWTKKRLPVRSGHPMDVIPQPNVVWALDFMSDRW